MKKTLLPACIAMIMAQHATAQTFAAQASGITPLRYSSVKFADIDGDGDLDLFATGANNSFILTSKMYKNDGAGNFTLHDDTTFIKTREGSSAFADFNGDSFPDLIVSGSTNAPAAKLYMNDGAGNFALSASSTFTANMNGSVACADLDNDGDTDVIITGMASSSLRVSEVYLNNGTGVFTLKSGSGLETNGVKNSSVALADVNGDGKTDLLITGILQNSSFSTKLFLNSGNAVFTASSNVFTAVALGSASFADIDNDGDKDLLLTGSVTNNPSVAQLYINDGLGNFTLLAGTPFTGVGYSSGSFADVNNDGYQDVFINGKNLNDTSQPNAIVARIYLNNGAAGGFTLLAGTPFTPTTDGAVAFADIDGDTDTDLLITGLSGNSATANLYLNGFALETNEFDNKSFRMYPNPVSDVLNIETVTGHDFTVTIRNTNRQVVLASQPGSTGKAIDCSMLSAGIYFVELQNDKGTGWNKLIKK